MVLFFISGIGKYNTLDSIASHSNQWLLTENEVYQIAITNDEVSEWIANHNEVSFIAKLTGEFWEVEFSSSNNMEDFKDYELLLLIISDNDRKIKSIRYWFLEAYFEESNSLSTNALDYFEALNITTEFLDNHFDFTANYLNLNFVQLNAINSSGFYINAKLAFNLTQDNIFTYDLIYIKTNFEFGLAEVPISQIRNNVNATAEVQNYMVTRSEYTTRIEVIYYTNSSYNNDYQGFFYEVEYGILEFDKFEFIQDKFLLEEKNNSGYTGLPSSKSVEVNITDNLLLMFDATGTTIDIEGTFDRKASYLELVNYILQDDEILNWVKSLGGFIGSLEYNHHHSYLLSIESLQSIDHGVFVINETTFMIERSYIEKHITPQMDELDVLNLINENGIINNWLKNIDNYQINLLFNQIGDWYVVIYDPTISQNQGTVLINDTSQSITSIELNSIESRPRQNNSDIIETILNNTSGEIENFYYQFPDAKLIFYYDNQKFWISYIFSEIFVDNYYYILIDDISGAIIEQRNVNADQIIISSFSDVLLNILNDSVYLEYGGELNLSFNHTYYQDGQWYHYLEYLSDTNFFKSLDYEITDTNLTQKLIKTYYGISTEPKVVFNEEVTTIFNFEDGNYHDLGRMYSIRLVDYLDSIPSAEQIPIRSSENFFDKLNEGFAIGVVILLVILISYKIKRIYQSQNSQENDQ
ncbi:MAG: hypothetical protein GPJ54_01870 [Candidatus Heimdallarchaeota archaeon]|nr:hypothetical protein [Candidatus Heimdallarchaeota archaeon]